MRDLSLHVLDLVQNSLRAGATFVDVLIEAIPRQDQLLLQIGDNGSGMPPELLSQVTDPFVTTRTTRPVGLGLALLRELCEQTGGQLELESEEGTGTRLSAWLGLSHIDRLPVGAMSETFAALLMSDPLIDYRLILRANDRSFELDTRDIRRHLEDVPLDHPDVQTWITTTIAEQQVIVFGGVLHEIIS
ncbi:MAG: ATP-binding protein [Eubacteriales bacterium]|nr:ATP-binding protein [Eubacteriales bacterium]MDD3866548.1 ATP-binding protein [Eubacteriales bacterium]MDD4461023.1 ATP-binding protein [Eubacteriales bacterium]